MTVVHAWDRPFAGQLCAVGWRVPRGRAVASDGMSGKPRRSVLVETVVLLIAAAIVFVLCGALLFR